MMLACREGRELIDELCRTLSFTGVRIALDDAHECGPRRWVTLFREIECHLVANLVILPVYRHDVGR